MSAHAANMLTGETATIPWKTRPDLTVAELEGERGHAYTVNDKVADEFFRFDELQHFVLESLRQPMTTGGLIQAIEHRFGYSPGEPEVLAYLYRLAEDNLLVSTGYGDGARLFRQHQKIVSGNWVNRVLGVLSIKLPGIYPGPLLATLSPLGRVLFHPVVVAGVAMAFVATGVFAMLSWQVLVEKTPAVDALLSPQHLLLMTLGFVIAKILHELGHGLACRQTGHECSEMGVLFLVMVPCLYCDVSDLWNAKNRFPRIFVSLAGIFVELLIATVCFWGWYYSLEGPLNRFLFSMMLVTSLNTLLVNGNPLMRYDGYYAIADFFRIPNLAAVAQQSLQRTIDRFFFKHEPTVVLHQQSFWLTLYAVGSAIYRWFIMGAIGWMAWNFFENLQLLAVGRTVVLALVVLAAMPALLFFRRYFHHAWKFGFNVFNTLVFMAVIGGAFWLMGNYRFEHRVSGTASFELANATQLFSPAAGKITSKVRDGQLIQPGQVIAEVVDEDLLLEQMIAQEQLDDVTARIAALKLADPTRTAVSQIEFWSKRQQSWQRKLADIHAEISKLKILAPTSGRFVAQDYPMITTDQQEEHLRPSGGSWADREHEGCFVERGQNLGYLAHGDVLEGTVQVHEHDILLVKPGQSVRVYLPFRHAYLVGKVSLVAAENVGGLPNDPSQEGGDDQEGAYTVDFQLPYDSSINIGTNRKSVVLCKKTNLFNVATKWIYDAFWL